VLRRPPTDAEVRRRFEVALSEAQRGGPPPTGVGFDDEVEQALWVLSADPSSDLALQRARDALEGQLSGANARARLLAERERALRPSVRPVDGRKGRGA